jgi:hypothetical protein
MGSLGWLCYALVTVEYAPTAERRMSMTEFISRKYGNDGYEVIIKTDSHEHYKAAENFARRLIDHAKPETNADRIRAMSDEELAYWVMCPHDDVCDCPGALDGDCMKCVLQWLQQPAEEDNHGKT